MTKDGIYSALKKRVRNFIIAATFIDEPRKETGRYAPRSTGELPRGRIDDIVSYSLAATAYVFSVEVDDMVKHARKRNRYARDVATWLIRRNTAYSLRRISEMFDMSLHTVSDGIVRVQDDNRYKDKLEQAIILSDIAIRNTK